MGVTDVMHLIEPILEGSPDIYRESINQTAFVEAKQVSVSNAFCMDV